MQLQIPQDLLYEGLQAVGRAVSARNTVPILSGVYLQAVGEELILKATDLELAIQKRVRADVRQDGEIVLPGRYLMELVRRLPPQEITISVDARNSTARITGSDCEYLIHGFPAEQFPADADEHQPTPITVNGLSLRTLLREVAFAASHDESRPAITGVAFSVKDSTLVAMAADGAVLAYGQVEVENPADTTFSVIIPGRSVQELIRLLGEHEASSCEILPSGSQFIFRLGALQILTRLLSGVYPDWLKLLPTEYPSVLHLDRERFLRALERAALLAPKGTVRLETRVDGLHVSANTPEVGQVAERVPAALEGPGFLVGLNVDYLLAGLKASSSPTLLLEFATPRSAVRFRSIDSRSFFCVLPLLSF